MYDVAFFEEHTNRSLQSAQCVVPLLTELFRPQSVLDIGCGEGAWLRSFRDQGVTDVMGIDGEYVDRSRILVSAQEFRSMDLEQPDNLHRRFDLAICLEVLEHLSDTSGKRMVSYLAQHADTIVFSAAIPGQGGTNHINEQWQSYWRAEFERHGYLAYDILRPRIWNESSVLCWYRQNIIIYSRDIPGQTPADGCLDVVHPDLFQLRLAQLDPEYWLTARAWLAHAPRILRRVTSRVLRRSNQRS